MVAGVILSGSLVDGTLGLIRIKQEGGIALVQDPHEALFRGMPESALDNVDVEFTGSTVDIASMLGEMLGRRSAWKPSGGRSERNEPGNPRESDPDGVTADLISGFACPKCGGVLREETVGDLVRYRCQVGHELSESALLHAQGEQVD